MFKRIFFIVLGLGLILPNISLAVVCNGVENNLNLCYPTFGPNGGSGLELDTSLNQIVAWFYYFIVTISGFSAFVMLVWGGFKYLSSAGNPSAIGDSKDMIQKALLGLLLILVSYLILQAINPDLIILQGPKI